MDARQFDDLTRRFATRSSRRQLLKVATTGIGLSSAMLLVSSTAASSLQECGELGSVCSVDTDCCGAWRCATSGTCGIVDTPCFPLGAACESNSDCCPDLTCTRSQTCGYQDGPTSDVESLPNTGTGSGTPSNSAPGFLGAAGVVIGAVGIFAARRDHSESDSAS